MRLSFAPPENLSFNDAQPDAVVVSPDGKKLAFTASTASSPKALFKTRMLGRSRLYHEYDVTADGQRFPIGTLIGESKATAPTVILNWMVDLKK